MDGKELNELRELVEFLKANDVAEFDMEREDLKVRLKFTSAIQAAAPPVSAGIDAATLAALMTARGANGGGDASVAPAPSAGAVLAAAHTAGAPVSAPAAAPADANEGLHIVKSPIVGTFYDAPSPGADAFVKVGDKVEVGTVLCIVEAMKLMNEIESDVAGEIVKVIPKIGQPVEYGQELFAIKPR